MRTLLVHVGAGLRGEDAILKYLADNCPGVSEPRFLANQNTEGLAFLFEGHAFIVMRGTEGNRADWFRNFKAFRTGPRDFIPPGVSWTAAPRHSGFAEGWDVIRRQVEDWVGGIQEKVGHDLPYIFTGHSLGGALSFIGAYEFAKRGREVAAVITFGAALPGGAKFGREYEELGLGVRTLRLEFDKDAVPIAQFPLLYAPVGFEWQLDKPPLTERERSRGEWVRSGLLRLLQSGFAKGSATNTTLPIFRSPLMALATILIYGVPEALAAVQAHNMQQRYALALTVLSYRRLRELGISQNSEAEYAACYDRLCRHLQRLRGSNPATPGLFKFLEKLPLQLTGKADLDALSAKFPDRIM